MEAQPVSPGLSPGAPPLAVAPIRAVVQAGSTETRYCRAGSGAPVLLLGAGGMAGPFVLPLFHALAGSFRVIAPEPPGDAGGDGVPVCRWLRDVIDGLGLARPSIVADESLGVACLSFALADPERVERLVLVRRDGALDDPLEDALALSGHPLLLLHAGEDVERCAAELTRFLNGRDDGGGSR